MLKDKEDAFGHMIWDYFKGKGGYEIVERDDGYFDISGGAKAYLSKFYEWAEPEKKAMKYVRGRVLDIGCGAGRHSLYLQEKGVDIVGIDNSPLAIKVCKLRGLRKAKLLSATQITSKLGKFDTLLMLGNNFGLFRSFNRARWLLTRLHTITSKKARIIAESRDPYQTEITEHLDYHKLNTKRGRMPGQLRIRIRYRKYVTPWFDYLLVSKEEMKKIVQDTGWEVKHFINEKSGAYIAIIHKES